MCIIFLDRKIATQMMGYRRAELFYICVVAETRAAGSLSKSRRSESTPSAAGTTFEGDCVCTHTGRVARTHTTYLNLGTVQMEIEITFTCTRRCDSFSSVGPSKTKIREHTSLRY